MTTIAERIEEYRRDSARYRAEAVKVEAAITRIVSTGALDRYDQSEAEASDPDLPISWRRFSHNLGDAKGTFFESLTPAQAGALMSRREWEWLYTQWFDSGGYEEIMDAQAARYQAELAAADAADLRDTQAGALEREG